MNATRKTGQRLLFPDTFGFSGGDAKTLQPRIERVDEFDDAETVSLLTELVRAVDARPAASPDKWIRRHRAMALRCEFRFPEIVQVCINAGLFPWLMIGRWVGENESRHFELAQRGKSSLGRRLALLDSGRSFVLDDGRRVRLSHRGRERHRHYRIELLG